MKSTRTGTVKPQAEEPLEEQRLTEDTAIETLFALAARLNRRRKEEYDLTFSSMLAAFMIANDQVSSWFKAYVRDSDAPISFFPPLPRLQNFEMFVRRWRSRSANSFQATGFSSPCRARDGGSGTHAWQCESLGHHQRGTARA
jgi:hypothetical protein